jgi:hypothetical protein
MRSSSFYPMRYKETHMLVLRTSRPKPLNGIGAALALGPRSASPAGAPCWQASSQANPRPFRVKKLLRPSIFRFAWVAVAVAVVALATPAFAAGGIDEVLRETHWGESSGELYRQFGTNAIQLPRALDFGDSYADVVVRGQTLGAVPMVVFFQMDKVTHGLKRIQLERPRHGVNPPALRAIAAALHAEFGKPDQTCIIPVLPAAGYQAAAEERWERDGAAVSVIFRDTTLQAFEGCLFGPATGWCGLHGQLLVRIGPPDGGADPCSLARHHGRPIASAPSGTPP